MSSELDQTRASIGPARRSGLLLMLPVMMSVAVTGRPTFASEAGDAPASLQQPPSTETRQQTETTNQAQPDASPEPSASAEAPTLCDALATAAMTNDLPIDFFTRLIWQESRFKPDAISPKGAQGIAQFMPATANLNGLENPFDPREAIAKSAQLLNSLRHEFGNLGLAAAAYNAGAGRVRDWLGVGRPLPQETRAYVQLVTGRSAEEWTGSHIRNDEIASAELVPCNGLAITPLQPNSDSPPPKAQPVKPWGVEVVGGPTPAKALARYRDWQSKYTAIIADREQHVVIRGIIGQMGAARVRIVEDTREAAQKLCAALKAAGAYCDVMRN
jgi:transglycosylase-like protein with SLT domain